MRKNLFLTCALALFAIVGVSAQNWCRTLTAGLPGQEITHDVNGTQVTQYRAETALIQNAGATGVRYTVMQTGSYNQIKGGGPTFALGEMIVLDAAGDTIGYTVTSNADHNTMGGAGNDGAGMPALNDGNLGNYFHSTWSAAAPDEFHYIELTFEKTIDAFQLIWYTRPANANNRPLVIGLTNPGVTFTEDMLFAEYEFELGEQVTDASELAEGGAFTFFATGPTEYNGTDGNGNTYIALSDHTTGSNTEACPQTIVQLIPGDNGKFMLYQPVLSTYYCDPNRWTDGYNGKNGWLRAYADAQYLDEFEFTKRGDGDFEITTEIYRQYVDGAWDDFDEPIKVWVGYDMRGNLKIFPQNVKEGLEQGDYSLGFSLPVDFGFTIYKANVNEEVVPEKSVSEVYSEYLATYRLIATEKKEEYAAWQNNDSGAVIALDNALSAANSVASLQEAYTANENLKSAIARLVATRVGYYSERYELFTSWIGEVAEAPYDNSDMGKYTTESVEILEDINAAISGIDHSEMTYVEIEEVYEEIDYLIQQFHDSKLLATILPMLVSDIPADNFAYSEHPNNAVWRQHLTLGEAVGGVRLTFLDSYRGSANDTGNFPMIAIGELKIYDATGNEVSLTASNFVANYTETLEGFESTVARLCDGNFGAQGYYHSPWSGSEPQEYIYLDITFPEAMDNFTFEVFSRDKSTSQNQVSLFPKKVAITKVGEAIPGDIVTAGTSMVTYIAEGEEIASYELMHGADMPVISAPFKLNYAFAGWGTPIDIASNADAMLYTNAPCTNTKYGDQFTSWDVLFDNDPTTIFHSEYADVESADGLDHYLRVDMGEGKPVTKFAFTYTNRNRNSSVNAPSTIVVEGSNEADGEYTQIAEITGLPTVNSAVYASEILGDGNAYRYIRFRVTATPTNHSVKGHPFFFISEFGMWNCDDIETMPEKDITLEAFYAEDHETSYGGIYYRPNGTGTLEVTFKGDSYDEFADEYIGDIVIPSTVTINGKAYTVTSIGYQAFCECSSLTSIEIPNSVTSIRESAFYYCSGLESITVAADNSVYDSREGCNAIIETANNTLVAGCQNTVIPNSVTSIGDWAFGFCTGLTSIEIPNSVTSIGNYAFCECSGLTSIEIPNSVTSIGESAFSVCSGLESITVAADNSVYDSREGCNAIIETANNTLVAGCKNTVIPNSVTSIGDWAFGFCTGLTSIEIPNSVTSIGGSAFYNCYNLVKIAVYNPVPVTLESNTFNGVYNATLYVPASAKAAYEAADVWNGLSNIVAMPTITYTVDGSTHAVVDKAPGFAIEPIEGPEKEHRTFVAWNNLPTVMPEEDVVATAVYDVYEVVIAINRYGSGTYCSPYALDFSGVEGFSAFAATGYNSNTGVVTVTRVNTAKGGAGLFIKGAANTSYVVPVMDSTGDNSLNMLAGTLAKTTVNATDGLYANYKYTVASGSNTPMFYRFEDGSSLGAGKAYLQIPLSWLPAEPAKSISIRFEDGETTDIDEITENGEESAVIYDLQGRKVENPEKGMYIINGKKVFVK